MEPPVPVEVIQLPQGTEDSSTAATRILPQGIALNYSYSSIGYPSLEGAEALYNRVWAPQWSKLKGGFFHCDFTAGELSTSRSLHP